MIFFPEAFFILRSIGQRERYQRPNMERSSAMRFYLPVRLHIVVTKRMSAMQKKTHRIHVMAIENLNLNDSAVLIYELPVKTCIPAQSTFHKCYATIIINTNCRSVIQEIISAKTDCHFPDSHQFLKHRNSFDKKIVMR